MDSNSPRLEPASLPPEAGTTFPPAESAAPPPPPSAHDRLPPALTVRLGVMRRIFLAVSGMDGRRRWRLAFTTFVGAAQVIAFTVILATSYHKPCDQNLKLYLVLLVVRIALSFPTALWSAITPHPSRRDSPERRQELERARLVGNDRIDHRVKKLSEIVSLYGLIVFLVGNIWVISSNTCSTTNPTLYRGALAAVVLSWLWILEFFLLCAFAILCLPVLLFGIRHWGWGEKKHEVGPLKKGDIGKLPRRIFTGTLPDDNAPLATPSAADADPKPDAASGTHGPEDTSMIMTRCSKSRRQLWRLWRSSRTSSRAPNPSSSSPSATSSKFGSTSASTSTSDFPPFPPKTLAIRLPASQNACAICLSEYEVPPLRASPEAAAWEPEILVVLPCRHAFHEACLVDWLAVSGRCALCQTPVFPPKSSGKDVASSTAPATAPRTTPTTTTTTTTTTGAPESVSTTLARTDEATATSPTERDRVDNSV